MPAVFSLVKFEKGMPVPVLDRYDRPYEFESGALAQAEAVRLSSKLGVKVQPRRAYDSKWRERERERMRDGTYQPLPWASAPWWKELESVWGDHFPHVSIQKQVLVAYTESPEKGAADVQTPIKLGKYLERYFTDDELKNKLTDYTIRDLCTVFASKFESQDLYFTSDPDEIEEVYTTGPNSCMSRKASDYGVPVHPVRAYAAGDLAIAYLRRKGRIVARALVWPDKHLHNTIYGDSGLMAPLLRKAGYKQAVPFGARFLKQKQAMAGPDFYYVLPHIDGAASAFVDEGEHLRLVEYKDGAPDQIKLQGGGAGKTEPVCQCPECSAVRAKAQLKPYHVRTKQYMTCGSCIEKKAVRCALTGNYHLKDEMIEVRSGSNGTKKLLVAKINITQGRIFRCEGSGEWWNADSRVTLCDGRNVSVLWVKKNGETCNVCGGQREAGKRCSIYE